MNRNLWSEAETSRLMDIFNEGLANDKSAMELSEDASKLLGRTAGACSAKYYWMLEQSRKRHITIVEAREKLEAAQQESTRTEISSNTTIRFPITSMTVDFNTNELVVTL